MMSIDKVIMSIIIMGLVTFFTRAFPFIFFKDKNPPELILYIEKYIPPVIMVILVIYCLKDIKFLTVPYGIPEIISVIFVTSVHLWKKNPLLSILGGTALYMALTQTGIISRLFG